MARRARTLWRELETESGAALLTECGVSWFAHRDDGWEAETERVLRELGHPDRTLVRRGGGGAFPVVRRRRPGVGAARAGGRRVRAQTAVQTLAGQAGAHGAKVIRARATPAGDAVALEDGRTLEGDRIVWSCGGWLPKLFPELVTLRVTRQELFFFDGGRLGPRHARAGSTTSARCTGQATSTRSA